MTPAWYRLANEKDVPSPSLLVFPDRAAENIRRMVARVGDVRRLRPHVKTHKLPEVVRMHLDAGITTFKAATPAECEMTAAAGAREVLLAFQPVGPAVSRLVRLARRFPATRFATVVDDEGAARALGEAVSAEGLELDVCVDIDCGMHRTGVEPGPAAEQLYARVASIPGLRAWGLHAYDGHLRHPDIATRTAQCEAAIAPVREMRDRLRAAGLPSPRIVAGGTPSFPVHARHEDLDCSPGTCVFWDAGYSSGLPDLDFLHAVVLLTRVISKPGGRRICLDLGHKAVASENPPPRAMFPEVPDASAVGHSEEHLVLETDRAADLAVGDVLYAIPWHVCPTVALHDRAVVVRDGRAAETWTITARARSLSA